MLRVESADALLPSSGFFISSVVFLLLNKLFPVDGLGDYDEVDVYGTFTAKEAAKHGIVSTSESVQNSRGVEPAESREVIEKKGED